MIDTRTIIYGEISEAELAVRIIEALTETPRPGPDPERCLDAASPELADAAVRAARAAVNYILESTGGQMISVNGHA